MHDMHKLPCNPEGVALRLRELIALHGGPGTVSALVKIPTKSLNHYMQGENLPGALSLACLCRGLGVSADWLLFGEVRI